MKSPWSPLLTALMAATLLIAGCSSSSDPATTPTIPDSVSPGALSFKDMGGRDTELSAPAAKRLELGHLGLS